MVEDTAPDRRVLRTKRVIRDAFTELMEEKGFDGITVKDLTEKADINRGTFYIHYRDKYDLLEQSQSEIIMEIESLAAAGFLSATQGDWERFKKGEAFPLPFVQKLFQYLQENASFMRVVLGPKGDPSFQKRLKEVIRNRAEPILTTFGGDMLVPVHYLTAYVSSAHLGVIQSWLDNGMDLPPEEMADILAKLTLLGPGHVAGITRKRETQA
ncbi:TetR/AcrR family transcriptional regulator C-terminal domain-containing protein [Paenibacillus sp. LHD-117]|uniref:TetR/AcrR family transcriptional regulator n=1 Tax=Paenibacillus sp. LHD-117 TaxID=3071412 RepID=UPI0027E0073E|nr:TetR/AcrR family transcriptional regulator C-terminal domain-containing protein [Paenibacillus sp. LHD-117]MDQ6422737.1 TetR/AcrR family transcriptional regulator C-terminal domain-containing protein [Paenibacillus sp. LHD-117]